MANEAGAPGPSCVTPIASAESYPPPAEHACAGCNPYQGSSTTVDDNAANSPAYALSTPAAQVSGGGGRQVDQETDEARAARVIQKHYRRHAARQKADERRLKMHPQARWDDVLEKQDEQSYADGQLSNKNDVKSRWQRGVKAAARIQRGDGVHTSTSLDLGATVNTNTSHSDSKQLNHPDVDASSLGVGGMNLDDIPHDEHGGAQLDKATRHARRARFWGKLTLPKPAELKDEEKLNEELPFRSKALEQQHWLEMVDHKHRYGSNIKFYCRKWKEANTDDNFFRWLDIGDGKDVDLEELPRDRLEKELITYLSAEQRLNYLVRLDKDGLLRWARNDELVDTAAGKWRDSGDGTGIIPDDSYKGLNPITEEQAYSSRAYRMAMPQSNSSDACSVSSWSSDSYSDGSLQEMEDSHYTGGKIRKGFWERKVKGVTPAGVRDELLRKTIKKNTWIYACDMKLNMFVGIKTSGTFQHSSFLAGGKVTSAGIIVVKHGVIKALGPWSGHYRSTIEHYRAFIAQLENKGADLSHVKVGKSVMQMWGLGKYTALTKQPQKVANNVKKVLGLKHEPDEMEASREVSRSGEAQAQAREKASGEAEEPRSESGKNQGVPDVGQEKADLGEVGAQPGMPHNVSAHQPNIADGARGSATVLQDGENGDASEQRLGPAAEQRQA